MKITEKAAEFLDKYSVAISDGVKAFVSIVGGIVAIGIGGTILHMNGIDISYDGNTPTVSVGAPSQKSSTPIDCNGLAESAIGKILDRAEDEYFDSGREAAAKDIRDIALQEGLTTAKTAAIEALSKISGDCDYTSTKQRIGAYIKEIAMSF